MTAIALDRIAAYVAIAGVLGIGAYLIYERSETTTALSSVASQVAGLDGRISKLPLPDPAPGTELEELRSQIDGWAARNEAANGRLTQLEANFAALTPADPASRSDLTALQTALESRIATLEANLSTIAPDTGGLVRKVAELEAQIASIPGREETLRADLHALNASVDELVAGRSSDRAAFGDRLEKLSQRLTALAAPEGGLRSDLDAVEVALASVSERVDSGLAELNGRIDGLMAAGAQSPLDQTTVELKLAELDAGISTLAASDPALRSDLDALRSTFDGWRQENAKEREMLDARLAELGELVAALPTPDPGLRADLETLRAMVDTQSEHVAASTAEIADRITSLDAMLTEVGGIEASARLRDEALSRLEARVAAFEQAQQGPRAQPRVLETFYFESASSELGEDELEKLRGLAGAIAEGRTRVAIIGFTDTVGPADYNRALSQRRAAKVRTLLLGLGIEPASIISVDGVGEDGTPINTADGEALANNRAVVIYAYE